MTVLALAAATLIPAAAAYAQDTRELYKVEFTLRDSADPVAKNGRKYSMLLVSRIKSVMKVGNRVPVSTGGAGPFTYIDVGVNIECVVDERGGKFAMHTDMDVSTVLPLDKSALPGSNPTISQIKLNFDTAVPPGKPTVVASFDDPSTSRRFDVDVTMTKM